MGFWKKLFGRKKIEEIETDNPEQIVYERDKVDLHDAEERRRYFTGCLEQIGEAEKEINLLKGEYTLVTSYLTDMEEIEGLPPEQSAELKGIAGRLLSLEQERKRYLDKRDRMTEREYRHMRSQEEEIEEGIDKLKEAEKYQKLIKQDLMRLDGERHAYAYRKSELGNGLANLRGMAIICLIALVSCVVMLLILQLGFSMDTKIGYYLSAAAAAMAVTVIFVRYTDAEKEMGKVEKAEGRLIQLQNTVKIRYVNNTNLLEYLYLKYDVESAGRLQELWNLYLDEKEERRQYAEAEAKLEYYSKQLVSVLSGYRVKSPERWVLQPGAIIDSREMIEIRHGLVIRRQNLRKQLDYNSLLAETAQQEIKEIAAEYPQYAMEITELLDKYTASVSEY